MVQRSLQAGIFTTDADLVVRSWNRALELCVEDTGRGISPEFLALMFCWWTINRMRETSSPRRCSSEASSSPTSPRHRRRSRPDALAAAVANVLPKR